MTSDSDQYPITGHGGIHATAAAVAHGARVLWTLSGAHIFPLYDAAVGGRDAVAASSGDNPASATGPLRLIDVRHESTAVFAAEATGKLTRCPGFAAVTAGPGVTNAISGITSAHFNGSPMVVLGGRAPQTRWGMGALQELDHPPLVASVTKSAFTVDSPVGAARRIDDAFRLAGSRHRGPVFLDVPMDVLFSEGESEPPRGPVGDQSPQDSGDQQDIRDVARALAAATRPVVLLGGDVWADGAEVAAVDLVTELGLPTLCNGMGRGILPPGHPSSVTRARSHALREADLVMVVGAPLDFRLGFGTFAAAKVVHVMDSPDGLAGHVDLHASAAGGLSSILTSVANEYGRADPADHSDWLADLRGRADSGAADLRAEMATAADPIHPARIYGELLPRLGGDSVVIGDGGDFVSFAGRYVEPERPGNWLDPGPFGCLGTGVGYAMAARMARPGARVALLLGDGAAGFSLMDVDTLVRHDLPVVMVVGNNSGWALEKHPMRFLYGYDVAADLRPTRYDEVVTALGGAGETVTVPSEIGPALDRAFAADVPYLVNVMTDPQVAYPRSTTGV